MLDWKRSGRGSGQNGGRGAGGSLAAALAVVVLAGCDLTVSNPGPIQEESLSDPGAFASVLEGAKRHSAIALGWLAYTAVYPTDEAVSSGISQAPLPSGILVPEQVDTHWLEAHRGRYLTEAAVARFREAMGSEFGSSPLAATALLHAGYAQRILGENFCHHVVDLGPAGDHRKYFEAAEAWFSEAIQVARGAGREDLELAAVAGRASTRIWLGDWPGAVSDAGQVPDDFVYQFRYLASLDWDDYNRLYFRIANEPWRRYTVWGTFYEDYYQETGDPRTPWTINPDFPIGNDGKDTPFYIQQKFTALDSPINVSSGREMRLLEAEALLRSGDWPAAVEIINGLRTSLVSDHTGDPLEPWAVASLEDAWTLLKRERGIELWLEGRRLPDLRRWHAEGAPGEGPDMTDRSLCFPIGETEHNTNSNDLPWDAPTG